MLHFCYIIWLSVQEFIFPSLYFAFGCHTHQILAYMFFSGL